MNTYRSFKLVELNGSDDIPKIRCVNKTTSDHNHASIGPARAAKKIFCRLNKLDSCKLDSCIIKIQEITKNKPNKMFSYEVKNTNNVPKNVIVNNKQILFKIAPVVKSLNINKINQTVEESCC